ncbi:MAG: tRNA uridine-5-carboxymethylaminomethyl(34) synthesis GTPase MnmE [Mycobacterium leprae]
MLRTADTISAIATGMGEAGIAVIRISGPDAVDVAARVFRPRTGRPLGSSVSHRVVYGWVETTTGRTVDEALAVVMRGPHSYTGEDVVEIHCHGGQIAVGSVLGCVLAAGARLAEPGEFTRRAFMNGRMDLAQAEAVIDIIRAKTDKAMGLAVRQLKGRLSEGIGRIRERLLEVTAHLEADIDFPELELEVQTLSEVEEVCRWGTGELNRLLEGARGGRILRDGLRVVLAGRPNVGKSSLLNRLLRENRAIVTEVPGTTRDVIEEWVNIKGFPVLLADTAGLRDTTDVVERIGVERTHSALSQADLVLLVIDAVCGVTPDDQAIFRGLPAGVETVLVINKVDLTAAGAWGDVRSTLGEVEAVVVSAATGTGIDQLEEVLVRAAGGVDPEVSLVGNARQEESLRRALRHLEGALETLQNGFGSDMISIDVRGAWTALGEVTGDSVGDDLLDQIFSRFCIGK